MSVKITAVVKIFDIYGFDVDDISENEAKDICRKNLEDEADVQVLEFLSFKLEKLDGSK